MINIRTEVIVINIMSILHRLKQIVSCVNREYPCDHYTSIINVTLMNTGCPRAPVHDEALQLLQLLDQRFFGNVGPLPATEPETGTYIFLHPFFNNIFHSLSFSTSSLNSLENICNSWLFCHDLVNTGAFWRFVKVLLRANSETDGYF